MLTSSAGEVALLEEQADRISTAAAVAAGIQKKLSVSLRLQITPPLLVAAVSAVAMAVIRGFRVRRLFSPKVALPGQRSMVGLVDQQPAESETRNTVVATVDHRMCLVAVADHPPALDRMGTTVVMEMVQVLLAELAGRHQLVAERAESADLIAMLLLVVLHPVEEAEAEAMTAGRRLARQEKLC